MRFVSLLVIAAASPAVAQPVEQAVPVPAALELFSSDIILRHWALRNYDADGDIALSAAEADRAAAGFKDIADMDRDGRVTTYEFDRAREFIVARF